MSYRPLGSSGLKVGAIGFGAWQLNNPLWGGPDEAGSVRLVQAALRFVLAHPEIATVIPGTKDRVQFEANLAAAAAPLAPEIVSAIHDLWRREIAANPPPW